MRVEFNNLTLDHLQGEIEDGDNNKLGEISVPPGSSWLEHPTLNFITFPTLGAWSLADYTSAKRLTITFFRKGGQLTYHAIETYV